MAGNEAAFVAQGHVDLQAVVTLVEEGEVSSAGELEARLNAEDGAVARVDVDVDGKPDRLRIVEKRAEKATTFEIHAIPSSKVEAEADAEVAMEAAPMVASLELSADADADAVTAKAGFSASFSGSLRASASADASAKASATVERTFSGITADAQGRLVVDANASAFVAWTFETARPTYVATVFVTEAKAEKAREPDPCWPPGHCKHGLWKARGELPPGQEAKHGHGDAVAHAKTPGSDAPRHEMDHASKSKQSKASSDPKGKSSSKSESSSKSSKGKSSSKSASDGKSKSSDKSSSKSASESKDKSKSKSKGKN